MSDIGKRFRRRRHRGVFTARRLSHWQSVLDGWCKIHEEYCSLVQGDAIYWNIERSNLGALAGAAWRLGWAALEEFPQPKNLKRKRFGGRADLFLKSPKHEDYVESKMTWMTLRRGQVTPADGVLRGLTSACKDASALHLTKSSERRVGIVFAVPYYRMGTILPLDVFDDFFETLASHAIDAAAWCFPECARELIWKEPYENVHPGVILVARTI